MKTLFLAAAFVAIAQDDDKIIAELVAKLPDAKASTQLVTMGDKAVPALLKAFVKESPWEERKISIESALWKIRGFRVSRAWTPMLVADQQAETTFVVRTKEEAAKSLLDVAKAFPGIDWDKETVVLIYPTQKNQQLTVHSVTEDAKAKTMTIKYDAVNRAGCGNSMRCESAVAIAVKKSDFKIVYESKIAQE